MLGFGLEGFEQGVLPSGAASAPTETVLQPGGRLGWERDGRARQRLGESPGSSSSCLP